MVFIFIFIFFSSFSLHFISTMASCVNNNQLHDPSLCRMIVSSDLIYSLIPNHFKTGSGVEIIMKYDLTEDSSNKNAVNSWNSGYDLYLKTSYDYTRWGGPLGM